MFRYSIRILAHHAYTLYLFTASDIVAVLCPQAIFAASCATITFLKDDLQMGLSTILLRLPYAVIWIWLELLVLDLSNQRRLSSVTEDLVNKPWRPIPSGRLNRRQADRLLLFSVPTTYVLSRHGLGGEQETVALFVLNWIYNDLGGAEDWIFRNVLNALGIASIGAGATSVVTGGSVRMLTASDPWLLICAGVLFTTIQAQDLYDQEGDSQRGRRTMPLVLGDGITRWLTAGMVLFWSIAVPAYWRMYCVAAWMTVLLPGLALAGRLLMFRDVESDRKTFKVWALWTIGLYVMPAFRALFC